MALEREVDGPKWMNYKQHGSPTATGGMSEITLSWGPIVILTVTPLAPTVTVPPHFKSTRKLDKVFFTNQKFQKSLKDKIIQRGFCLKEKNHSQN